MFSKQITRKSLVTKQIIVFRWETEESHTQFFQRGSVKMANKEGGSEWRGNYVRDFVRYHSLNIVENSMAGKGKHLNFYLWFFMTRSPLKLLFSLFSVHVYRRLI